MRSLLKGLRRAHAPVAVRDLAGGGHGSSTRDDEHAIFGCGCAPLCAVRMGMLAGDSRATHAHKARMGTRSIDVVRKWRHDWTIEGILRQPNQFAELKPTNRDL